METRYLPNSIIGQPDGFVLVGAGLCGGHSYAWINSTVQNWLKAFGMELTEAEVWHHLGQQMKFVSNDGLVCKPYFSGTRCTPERRGTFEGISDFNFSPAQIAHSILQGIATSMYDVFESAACLLYTSPSPRD